MNKPRRIISALLILLLFLSLLPVITLAGESPEAVPQPVEDDFVPPLESSDPKPVESSAPTPKPATGTNAEPTPSPTAKPATGTNADRTDISGAAVTFPKKSYAYTGSAQKPAPKVVLDGVTLVKGTDYKVSYKNNKDAGTATVTVKGLGKYTGTVTATFTIKKASIKSAAVKLSQGSYKYDGKAKKPGVTVALDDVTLVKGTDYKVSYTNNKQIGKATVTIKGIGNYSGKITASFNITKNAAKEKLTASGIKTTWSPDSQVFYLTVSQRGNGTLTFKSNNASVKVNKTGKVRVAKNFVGKAVITITSAATNDYGAATKKVAVTVKPAATELTSVKNSAAGKITVKWAKTPNAGATGYQIRYSASQSFSSAKKVTVRNPDTVSKRIGKLTKGSTYYVQIRVFQKVDGKNYFSAWSSAVACTIKK